MTRFLLHYYTSDDGWMEFKTKEGRDQAKKELEEGTTDLNDLHNSSHWLHHAVIDQRGTLYKEEYEEEDS
tara:strand:- start:856 stop:1065 length:210 start_codon:yes stop_codon:yes gene_type:complete